MYTLPRETVAALTYMVGDTMRQATLCFDRERDALNCDSELGNILSSIIVSWMVQTQAPTHEATLMNPILGSGVGDL